MSKRNPASYWKGVTVVTDTPWGDNGKGKFVDLASQHADCVIRFNGGNNAGHTIEYGKIRLISHVLPSGFLSKRKPLNIITGGVVIDPFSLLNEIKEFRKQGVQVNSSNLLLHHDAHLIMPWHILRDKMREIVRGGKNIGTTGRGIGPSYADQAARVGLRVRDLYKPDFKELFKREFQYQERKIRIMMGEILVGDIVSRKDYPKIQLEELKKLLNDGIVDSTLNTKEIIEQLSDVASQLKPMVKNVLPVMRDFFRSGKNILGEAGQGGLLDLLQGNYPFVTSSHPGASGFTIATNIQGNQINNVLGVTKAYTTRVGGGPMPTELLDESGEYLRTVGHEYGATTGRPRRCGWFDGLAVKYGAEVTGSRRLAVTKLDVLDDLDEIQICVGYKKGSVLFNEIQEGDASFFEGVKPVYITMKGWKESTKECKEYNELPKNAREYINKLEKITEIRIDWVGVGAQRDSTIYRG